MVATTISLPDFWVGFIVGILFCVGIFIAAMIISFRKTKKLGELAQQEFEQKLTDFAGKHERGHSINT